MSITFQKAIIVTNETFMRTDTIHHYLIIRFLDKEIKSPIEKLPGLNPEWNFRLDLRSDDLESNIEFSIHRYLDKIEGT